MKIKDLIEKLEDFNPDTEICIQTQNGYALYADIGCLEELENDSDMPGDKQIVVMNSFNESCSIKQALQL